MPAMTWERQGTWPPRLCPGATAVPHWFSGRPGGRGSRPGRQTFCAVTAVLVLMLPRHPLDLYGPHRSKVDRTSRVLLHHPQHNRGAIQCLQIQGKQVRTEGGNSHPYLWGTKQAQSRLIGQLSNALLITAGSNQAGLCFGSQWASDPCTCDPLHRALSNIKVPPKYPEPLPKFLILVFFFLWRGKAQQAKESRLS